MRFPDLEFLAAPLRALAPVEADALGPMALTDVAQIHGDPTDAVPSWGWGTPLTEVDDGFATALTTQFHPASALPFLGIEVRHLGGATRTDVGGGSAVGGRGAEFALHVLGAPDPSLHAEVLPRAAAGFRGDAPVDGGAHQHPLHRPRSDRGRVRGGVER